MNTESRVLDQQSTGKRSSADFFVLNAVLALLAVYRFILSPVLQAAFPHCRCRFTPSCSEYATEAVRLFGTVRGGTLAVKRIARCHPFGQSGHDPVPLPTPSQNSTSLKNHG